MENENEITENPPEIQPESEEEPKPQKVKRLRAEFNIADKILEEYLRVMGEVNRVAAYSLAGDEKFNRFFFSVAFVYYINLSAYMGTAEQEKYDKEFKEVMTVFDDKEKKHEVPFKIMHIYRKLLSKASDLGFLVPMYSKAKGRIRLSD